MNEKFQEFLIIAERLNQQNIVPLLMGSVGLEFLTQKDWDSKDVDIHVNGDPRGWELPDDEIIYEWCRIIKIMTQLNYQLVDNHEHKFKKNTISVGYGVIDTLPDFADVSLKELICQNVNNVKFYTPTLEAFLKIYKASSQDSYRADKNNHKDLKKIDYLINKLT